MITKRWRRWRRRREIDTLERRSRHALDGQWRDPNVHNYRLNDGKYGSVIRERDVHPGYLFHDVRYPGTLKLLEVEGGEAT